LPPQALIVGPAGRGAVILDAHWRSLCQRALDALRAFHQQYPDEPGIDRGRLRRITAPTIADAFGAR
jgi:selenocysteine-specific elongation factor